MSRFFYRCSLVALLVVSSTAYVLAQNQPTTDLIRRFRSLRDTSTWKQIAAIPLLFPVHHPQGMVKVDDHLFISSVEVLDRAASKGVGHLFEIDADGKLLADVKLGEGAMYHPGGIDYDGQHIWVPVAEYRPNSNSVVYRVDPRSLRVTEVFRFSDHLGGIVHDTDAHSLHGISWGSRLYYDWGLDAQGRVFNASQNPDRLRIPNPSYYIDYQDCHYVGNHLMLCGGLKSYRQDTTPFRLGGMELVDLTTHQPVHQVPVQLWAPSGRPMTQNPFWLETTHQGLRSYFIPDDGEAATLYVYEVLVK